MAAYEAFGKSSLIASMNSRTTDHQRLVPNLRLTYRKFDLGQVIGRHSRGGAGEHFAYILIVDIGK